MVQMYKARRESGQYMVEGSKMFLEAETDEICEIYLSDSYERNHEVLSKLNSLSYESISDDLFRKISDTVTPQGILCVMKQKKYSVDDMIAGENPLLMILEDIQDPGNLGTILRTGEGAGIGGVIMTKGCVDIYNPKTIRSTMGSIYRVPFVYTENLPDTVKYLKDNGIYLYAAHLKGQQYYDEVTYLGKGNAFLIGNEGNGLKEETAKLADTYIKIPMSGRVESLNAAVASSVLMYEVFRQLRSQEGKKC